MDHSIISFLSIVLLILGILGTFLPVLPGLVLSLAGLLIYKYGTDADLSVLYIWAFVILTLASVVLSYVIPAKTNRKYGGTRWGSIGSVIGTIVGIFLPIPLGFLVGMFAGVFIGELLHDSKDMNKALKSTKGAFIGFIYGTGFSLVVGIAMLLVVILDIVNVI
ncbi:MULTISPECIES: DUF456 domain-containing protein [Chryseobacterium]|jgi:uncharacterized protein YqgC (DUF456 family)|uniref:Protein of uncharacterized function (DUF456) n=2 Tax=Chryseobacterium TaxID=59732 RepID=A0AAX2IK43_9FLAO|nr:MULTISPECIES: DUF456 domain-containing protein [Chryseobacterium]AZB30431.1 DUF456 domain-containing protein [Chryseobacterium balustinum]REC55661.1 DUF456 domain-containing protein [Chryseobacterium piscium]SKB47513.1 hypothetical protein SAMN05421800_102103 [Chryseobacterium balustinum]SQA89166.1 Protein of uncharacterised function (DUF456) [Chryseobacterium balustinum]